ncbi:hypothetical protein BC628DRAFT_1417640 [Trametes gibbosa]|nr:hypothetical protein BC628DRAFT_1417640 [Trametes gibbosa]
MLFNTIPVIVLVIASVCVGAAPVDRRGIYTGRLFAHHAHERVGPTPVATEDASPATLTAVFGTLLPV